MAFSPVKPFDCCLALRSRQTHCHLISALSGREHMASAASKEKTDPFMLVSLIFHSHSCIFIYLTSTRIEESLKKKNCLIRFSSVGMKLMNNPFSLDAFLKPSLMENQVLLGTNFSTILVIPDSTFPTSRFPVSCCSCPIDA